MLETRTTRSRGSAFSYRRGNTLAAGFAGLSRFDNEASGTSLSPGPEPKSVLALDLARVSGVLRLVPAVADGIREPGSGEAASWLTGDSADDDGASAAAATVGVTELVVTPAVGVDWGSLVRLAWLWFAVLVDTALSAGVAGREY